ncbi:unnamed protein product [Rodentolepis nana]|uniref:SH3 domain-containing protein n=1 Tax=Rodentolepis nana TaxID=102285 RepID=A0A158QGR1_RODNA|nr:unnamed protein product [Rodentolepis nana]
MFSQRRCPCCYAGNYQESEYQIRPQKKPKHQKVEQPEMEGEVEDGKPYAYLGEGEIWANGAFLKILRKKYCADGEPVHKSIRHASPGHSAGESMYPPVRYASPTHTIQIPMHSPSPRRPRVKSPSKSGCTYRVAPIKSKNDIRDGDLIIETSDHKYLRVLGPRDCSQGDDFYVCVENCKKPRRQRAKSYSSSSSSSSTEEEAHYSRTYIPTTYVNTGNRCNCPG